MSKIDDDAWQSLGFDEGGVEKLVREWQPGDGLHCSFHGHQKRIPCSPPVALMMTIDPKPGYYKPGKSVRLLCPGHLVAHALGNPWRHGWTVAGARLKAEKAAKETVLHRHWDEYVAEMDSRLKATRAEQLEQLPEVVRSIFSNLDWDTLIDQVGEGGQR